MLTSPAQEAVPAHPGNSVHVLEAGALAAACGVAVAEAYAAIVKAAGIAMRAGFLGTTLAGSLTYGSFAVGVVVSTFWGTVLGLVLVRLSRRPRRTFVAWTAALVALSLIVPLGAGDTTTSTKIALAVAHLLVASIGIPILARALAWPGRPTRSSQRLLERP